MRRAIMGILLLATALMAGCSTVQHAMNPDTPDAVLQAQDRAEAVVMGFQAAFKATPQIVDALLKNGTLTPHTYNTQVLPAYNRGLASLNTVVEALKAAHEAKQDPSQNDAYIRALARFLTDKTAIDNLLAAFGKGGAS